MVFSGSLGLPAGVTAADYQLLKSTQSAHAWQYPANNVIQNNLVDLESVTRGIVAGDVILFEATRTISILSDPPPPQLACVITYTEVIWFANADSATPQTPPTQTEQATVGPPIPIPHSELKFRGTPNAGPISAFNAWSKSIVIRFGYQPVGQLIATPATALDATTPQLTAAAPTAFAPGASVPVMIEDANGTGAGALASVSSSSPAVQKSRFSPFRPFALSPSSQMAYSLFQGSPGKTVINQILGGGAPVSSSPPVMHLSGFPSPPPALTPPLNVLYGLFQVSRGKTVTNEILGSGDATQAGQEFVLKNSPLTYLLSAVLDFRPELREHADGSGQRRRVEGSRKVSTARRPTPRSSSPARTRTTRPM